MSQVQPPSRADVLAVAESLLAHEGPPGLSVRRIAEALGVSRQIVYSRFCGKPDLVRALHAEGFTRLTEGFSAVSEPAGSTAHVLAMGRAYRSAALSSPALFGLMFGRPILEFEPDAQAREVALEAFAPVLSAARAWLRAHDAQARDPDALRLAQEVWAATHGVVTLETSGLLGLDAPELIDHLLRSILGAALLRGRSGAAAHGASSAGPRPADVTSP